jgi:hypothetical protein
MTSELKTARGPDAKRQEDAEEKEPAPRASGPGPKTGTKTAEKRRSGGRRSRLSN